MKFDTSLILFSKMFTIFIQREGGDKNVLTVQLQGLWIEPGTSCVLAKSQYLHTNGRCFDKSAFPWISYRWAQAIAQ